MGLKLNRADLAAAMGVTLITIDNWRREGMPQMAGGTKGVACVFDLAEVVKWYAARKAAAAAGEETTDVQEIERRTARAKMEMVELELAKKRGEVATIRDFERAQAKLCAEIRANVLNVTQRVVLQLLGETDEATFKRKLTAELTLALQAAADADLTLAEDDEGEQAE